MTGPLTGVRIVMMGGLGPGPFCGMLLADLGADVVRVDRVGEVDGPPAIDRVLRRGQRSIAVDVREELFHSVRAVHGSVYFKSLDDAAFFAAASLVTDEFLVTSSFQIYFLRPVSDGSLIADGRVVHAAKRYILAESVLTNERGREIARGSGYFMKSGIALDPSFGYAVPDR